MYLLLNRVRPRAKFWLICLIAVGVHAQPGLDVRINFGEPLPKVDFESNKYLKQTKMFLDTFTARAGDVFEVGYNFEKQEFEGGANPNSDENVYRTCYAASYLSGNEHYSNRADISYKNWLSSGAWGTCGTFYWGEHGSMCEHCNTPSLQAHWWRQNAQRSLIAAQAYWDCGIWDKENGYYNRHCSEDGGSGHDEYPRHGAYFTLFWGEAFKRSFSDRFLHYTEILCNYFDTHRTSTGQLRWKAGTENTSLEWQTLSAGVDFWTSLPFIPRDNPLYDKVIEFVLRNDTALVSIFPVFSRGREEILRPESHKTNCMMPGHSRYWQLREIGEIDMANRYREGIIQVADQWLNEVNVEDILWAGHAAHAIHNLLVAEEFTKDEKYLNRAKVIADAAIERFFVHPIPYTANGLDPELGGSYSRFEKQYWTSGGSDNNSGVPMLPLSLLLLGTRIEQPNVRIFMPSTDR